MTAPREVVAWWRASTLPECAPVVTVHRDEAEQWRREGHDVRELRESGDSIDAQRYRKLRAAKHSNTPRVVDPFDSAVAFDPALAYTAEGLDAALDALPDTGD